MKRGKSRTVIWNTASRHHMYSRLKSRFGVFHTWKSESPPGYNSFLAEYAKQIGASSPQAVAHQIRFTVSACKMKDGISNYWNQCQGRTGIGNLNAALESGFIRQRDLPDFIVRAGSRKGPKDPQPDLWEEPIQPKRKGRSEAMVS